MNLKVIEKSRKLLIQVMGQHNFEKFIENGKIEIKHGDIIYELDHDARVYNRTKKQSYCIEPICSENLPLHDQLAIKYGYLKTKINKVEEVANKRNLGVYEPTRRIPLVPETQPEYTNHRPCYLEYVDYLENHGWRRNQVCLEELNTNIVTIKDSQYGTTNNVIDIRCPAGQKITIKGIHQLSRNEDARTAHSLRVMLSDSDNNEIPLDTKIRIIKHKVSEAVIQLARIYYGDINITKNVFRDSVSQLLYKTDQEFYRFSQGIELYGEQHIELHVINCEKSIDAKNTKLSLECDIWHME